MSTYVHEFWLNLGNRNTSMIIGFLTGYVIGISKLSKGSSLVGLVFGLLLSVFVGIISGFIDFVLPEEITVIINLKSMFTMILLVVFFVMASSLL